MRNYIGAIAALGGAGPLVMYGRWPCKIWGLIIRSSFRCLEHPAFSDAGKDPSHLKRKNLLGLHGIVEEASPLSV